MKLGNIKEALHFIEKSLSEHRDPEIVKKLKQLEKQLKEEEKKAYINPEISEEEKVKGNEFFKNGKSISSVFDYFKAIILLQ